MYLTVELLIVCFILRFLLKLMQQEDQKIVL